MNITLGVWAYWGFAALSVPAFVGLAYYGVREFPKPRRGQRGTLIAFAASVLVAFLLIVALQVRYWDLGWGGDPQGRYLFPVLIPLATLFLLGTRAFIPRARVSGVVRGAGRAHGHLQHCSVGIFHHPVLSSVIINGSWPHCKERNMQGLTWKRFTRLGLLGTCLLLLAVSSGYAARVRAEGPTAPPKGVTKTFGIDEGGILGSNTSAAQQAAQTGVNWVRTEIDWGALEPTPGVYDFTGAEHSLNRLLGAGLSPVVYFADNPGWAANTTCGPVDTTKPKKLKSFANANWRACRAFPRHQAMGAVQ